MENTNNATGEMAMQSGVPQRLDPIGKLFGDAWRLLNEKGATVFKIMLIPVVLTALPRFVTSGNIAATVAAGALALIGGIFFVAAIPASINAYDGRGCS